MKKFLLSLILIISVISSFAQWAPMGTPIDSRKVVSLDTMWRHVYGSTGVLYLRSEYWNRTHFAPISVVGTVSSVSGTSNRITVTNPTSTPVVDIAGTYVGQTSIITLGTITTGTWNAGAITSSGGISGTTGNFSSIGALGSSATVFLTQTGGLLQSRTAAQVRTDIGAGTGDGTVTAVSIATANGFSGSSSGGTTPALTIVAGAITPTSVALTGTGGAGFLALIPQSSAPSTPVSGVRLYSRSTGAFSMVGVNGFTRSLVAGITQDVVDSIPDFASGTLVLQNAAQTLRGKTILASNNTISGITNANLSGTAGITNANLANNTITIGTTSISLGGSSAAPVGFTSIGFTNNSNTLTLSPQQLTGTRIVKFQNKSYTIGDSLDIAGKVSNVLTTTGDIIYSSSGSTPARLAIGASTTVLHGGTIPSYSQIVNGDITNATIDLTAKVTGILPNANTTATAAATASTIMARDANINSAINNLSLGYTTTTTSSSGTTTLTVASTYFQYFTGTLGPHTVQLPVASTLVLGQGYSITNNSSVTLSVNSSGGNLIVTLSAGQTVTVNCILTSGTTAASWFTPVGIISNAPYISNSTATGPGGRTISILARPTEAAVMYDNTAGISFYAASKAAILASSFSGLTAQFNISATGGITAAGGITNTGVITNNATTGSGNGILLSFPSGTTTTISQFWQNSGVQMYLGLEGSLANIFSSGTSAYATFLTSNTAIDFATGTGGGVGNGTIVRYAISATGAHDFKSGTALFGGAITQSLTSSMISASSGGLLQTTTVSTPLSFSGSTLSIADAVANGSTKGAATFTAADFDAASGVISIDYTNGQAATGSVPGFLTAANFNTFNGKENVITFSTGLTRSVNTVTVNTTQNILKLSGLTTNGVVYTTAGDGTLNSGTPTIGGVTFTGASNITVATATGGFTVSGGNLALGTNSITMSGSIGVTGTRVTKGWFTDIESSNAIVADITGNAATVTISDGNAISSSQNLTFVSGTTGAAPIRLASTKFNVVPSTGAMTIAGTMTAATFSGAGTSLTGTAVSLTAGVGTLTTVSNDASTNATYYPTYVTSNTGNQGVTTASSKLTFNPSTGVFSSTSFTGAGTGLTGTAASLNIGGNSATATNVAASGITGTTLASGVVTSSLTSVGTITSGIWQSTSSPIQAIYGGTNQTSWTTGQMLYSSSTNNLSKLSIGSTGDVLTVVAGVPAWVAPSGGGVTTMAAIGSSPNANGASISGSTLTLQPANGSFGGVVTTGTQSFAGTKTFLGDVTFFSGQTITVNSDADFTNSPKFRNSLRMNRVTNNGVAFIDYGVSGSSLDWRIGMDQTNNGNWRISNWNTGSNVTALEIDSATNTVTIANTLVASGSLVSGATISAGASGAVIQLQVAGTAGEALFLMQNETGNRNYTRLQTDNSGSVSSKWDVGMTSPGGNTNYSITNLQAFGVQNFFIRATSNTVNSTSDFVVSDAAKGFVLSDTNGHFWRITISTLGVLSTADLGTTQP